MFDPRSLSCPHTPPRAAGVLLRARSTGRYLLVLRSDGAGWSIPGGHVEPGETAREAALRELREETDFQFGLPRRASPDTAGCGRSLQWSFETFCVTIKAERAPRLDHEHTAFRWVTRQEALGMRLHPGLREVLG